MNTEQILARELEKAVTVIGGAGAASGLRFANRFFSTELFSRECLIPCDAKRALRIIANVLTRLGRIEESDEVSSPNPTITAIVGSGFMKMNPCVVAVEIVSHSDKETKTVIHGAAKEGLIKQHTANKAVTRVIEGIKSEGAGGAAGS